MVMAQGLNLGEDRIHIIVNREHFVDSFAALQSELQSPFVRPDLLDVLVALQLLHLLVRWLGQVLRDAEELDPQLLLRLVRAECGLPLAIENVYPRLRAAQLDNERWWRACIGLS